MSCRFCRRPLEIFSKSYLVDESRGWISWMNLVDSNLVNLVDESRGWISWIQISWISWINLVDESRESRGWTSWMNLVDSNLVNLVDRPWGLRLQNRSWGAIFWRQFHTFWLFERFASTRRSKSSKMRYCRQFLAKGPSPAFSGLLQPSPAFSVG